MMFVDENGQEHTWSGSSMLTTESQAEDAGVVITGKARCSTCAGPNVSKHLCCGRIFTKPQRCDRESVA